MEILMMEITVMTTSNEVCKINIPEDANVTTLKKAISKEKNVSDYTTIAIVYRGMELKEHKKLAEYNINNGSNVFMVIRKKKSKPSVAVTTPTVTAPNTVSSQSTLDQQQELTPEMCSKLLQEKPEMFMQLLLQDPRMRELNETNPGAIQKMMADPEFVTNMMRAAQTKTVPNDNDRNDSNVNNNNLVQLTETELADINTITEMGFNRNDVIQYYMLNNKDINAAVNMLWNEKAKDEEYELEDKVSGELTDEDLNNIDQMVSMGFDKSKSLEYYIVCDKDKKLAIDMMLKSHA
uniref:Ubiquitin family protein n=1 Tax=Mimivirus LCMiAC01 TaxID=2506608 RepID=A0A481Z228_9VIRU|nr:MAG: ubiquitin family protein [Mimivirus LCMiAC01]